MSYNAADDLRSTAALLISNTRTMSYRSSVSGPMSSRYDMTRAHSSHINLITEEFLGGYMQDGRMSVVRRFFCLFVTFDLFFVSLLWLICIMINGDNIFQAFQKQILHYTIYTSLFDTVVAAICRFVVLIFFYALLYMNHWSIIALSTSGSCLFLISKVFFYDWVSSKQQVFEVVLIIISFVLAWGEAWFLDCRVLPQERHARRFFSSSTSDQSPIIAPFLATHSEARPPESVANFYSPLDTNHNSDDEEEQDEEYHQMGLDCVRKVYELIESSDWKMEKVTPKGDTIYSKQREKVGKIYRLTTRLKYNAKALNDELFYRIEFVPKWNPTLLESKIVHKINSYCDITYQATVGGGGGMVKSRDFVNLRCWRFFRNGHLCEDDEDEANNEDSSDNASTLNRSCEGSVSTVSDGESYMPQASSVSSVKLTSSSSGRLYDDNPVDSTKSNTKAFQTLSKSLGAKDFSATAYVDYSEPPPLEEDEFADAKDHLDEAAHVEATTTIAAAIPAVKSGKDRAWVSAAISIDYAQVPPTTKYTRGENIIAGFVMREIEGKTDACIFEWILCLDLKGYIPRYVLDAAYTSFMTDYMNYLRKYVSEMRQKRKRVPKN